MSFPASRLCTGVIDPSLHYSFRPDTTQKCLLRFSKEFLNPSDKISRWYDIQPYKRFRTIQYRKARAGVRHEFIIIQLLGDEDQNLNIKAQCRVERSGDPQHILQTAYIDGTIAEDYIQATPEGDSDSASLTRGSEVVAEITFPLTFDLRDVLAICYGISKHRRAQRYTLQQYNCYFFSWTIILLLARACVNWDTGVLSLEEHVQNIRDGILSFIKAQGPKRFDSIPYIWSNSGYPHHDSKEGHPLDICIESRLNSRNFTKSITTALNELLWVARLRPRILSALRHELGEISKKSIELLASEITQHKPIKISNEQRIFHRNLECAIRKVIRKAVLTCFDGFGEALSQAMRNATRDAALVKQRMGSKLWYKCLRGGTHRLFHSHENSKQDGKTVGSHPHGPTELSIRDGLLILPSYILSVCLRLVCAGVLSGRLSVVQFRLEYKTVRQEGTNRLRQKIRCIRSAIGRGTLESPKFWAVSGLCAEWLVYTYALEQESSRNLCDFSDIVSDVDKIGPSLEKIGFHGWDRALEMLNNGLQDIIEGNREHGLNDLRRVLLVVFEDIRRYIPWDFECIWEWVLLHYLLIRVVEVSHSHLEGHVEKNLDIVEKLPRELKASAPIFTHLTTSPWTSNWDAL